MTIFALPRCVRHRRHSACATAVAGRNHGIRAIVTALAIATVMWTVNCRADEAFIPPAVLSIHSANGAFLAVSDPTAGVTSVRDTATHELLWTLPGWHRWIFVSNDGKHVVTGYDGMNLIPRDSPDDLILFTFWREGVKVRDVTLREFVPSRSILKRTVSHFHWGALDKIDKDQRMVVRRADEKVFRFDLDTGKPVE